MFHIPSIQAAHLQSQGQAYCVGSTDPSCHSGQWYFEGLQWSNFVPLWEAGPAPRSLAKVTEVQYISCEPLHESMPSLTSPIGFQERCLLGHESQQNVLDLQSGNSLSSEREPGRYVYKMMFHVGCFWPAKQVFFRLDRLISSESPDRFQILSHDYKGHGLGLKLAWGASLGLCMARL